MRDELRAVLPLFEMSRCLGKVWSTGGCDLDLRGLVRVVLGIGDEALGLSGDTSRAW